MQCDFSTSNRIIFGKGCVNQIADLIKPIGRRRLIIQSSSVAADIDEILSGQMIETERYTCSGEPDIDSITTILGVARQSNCDFVISIGGGSVIDTGKAVSALLTNQGNLLDYLEVVGKGLPLTNPSKPFIAIPTTAGTGSEVTKNAVIDVPSSGVKVSMRSTFMLPLISLVDPLLTIGLPPKITAATGMDAFTQVIEPYVSKRSNPMVDMFCRDAIPRAAKNLILAYLNGNDFEARENMAWVSLLGGLSLANAGLGAVHGFAGVIGGMYHSPHGEICASLLPAVISGNITALQKKDSKHSLLDKYQEIAIWVTGKPKAKLEDALNWFEELGTSLEIPKLSHFGIQKDDFNIIVQKSKNASSMKANPIELNDGELFGILEAAF